MGKEELVLVTTDDQPVGAMEKLAVHSRGLLHRAFSAFLFDRAGRMLLQRRAEGKYHSPGLWSNACCGHPRPGEVTEDGVRRRLREELGVDCPLEHLGSFEYRAEFGNGLVEHEIDHVFVGTYDGPVYPNPSEVERFRWIEPLDLSRELDDSPQLFTAWFGLALDRFGLLTNPIPDR